MCYPLEAMCAKPRMNDRAACVMKMRRLMQKSIRSVTLTVQLEGQPAQQRSTADDVSLTQTWMNLE